MVDLGKIECPKCRGLGKTILGKTRTLLGHMPRYDEKGILVSRDPNISTHHLSCRECGCRYGVQEQYGELIGIVCV